MKQLNRAPISDAEFNAVRALAAEGRPIPAIIMAAIVERLEANAEQAVATAVEPAQPQAC